jgi:hypothetical protein
MKRIALGLFSVSLAFALVAPAWAQTPSPPMEGKKTGGQTRQTGLPGQSTPPAPSPAMAGKKTGGPTRHTYATHNASGMSDAERLNAAELTELRMNSPAAVSTAPGGNNPTSGAAGPFAPK